MVRGEGYAPVTTPICDFVQAYARRDALRLHMPGHKGEGSLGVERLDITEVEGADVLYAAEGIIRESEETASALFGTERTFYSTEGSSLAIRAMVLLTARYAAAQGKRPAVAALRNAHKTFLTAAALVDVPIHWLYGEEFTAITTCKLSPGGLERELDALPETPTALYVTSPDYLGNVADIAGFAAVCRKRGILLLVDNAHGAYLRFLPQSRHPIQLGADLCCDSAHKTLPVLTGGAYLHVSPRAPGFFGENGESALGLFASTSPSYLILQSLDRVNQHLAGGFREEMETFCGEWGELKDRLRGLGFVLEGDEPLKLTIAPKSWGYTGTELARFLEERGVVCEFADPDYTVMIAAPALGPKALGALEDALRALPRRAPLSEVPPPMGVRPRRVCTPRETLFAPSETVDREACLGRVMADVTVSCPPAVPIVVCGEEIGPQELALLRYYGVERCRVLLK